MGQWGKNVLLMLPIDSICGHFLYTFVFLPSSTFYSQEFITCHKMCPEKSVAENKGQGELLSPQ